MVSIAMDQIQSERLVPITKANEQAVPLSLIDATTSDFLTTSAVWLFERPDACGDQFHLADHLRQSPRITLDAYPMFCGLLKGITTHIRSEDM
ncbi:transferase family protein [Penicillium hispanicum]|uniref:transferase family protein n=1 Tax=Penicillium hispanicum TaxID=1080232 RepID=UPI00253FAF8D|nr:transferase family protein [Penicillium hispanicum]KAJ5569677.1 transferase family protein [Penicillium hispanicum]